MYKRSNKYEKTISKSYSNSAKVEHLRETGVEVQSTQHIPELRRVIEITDFDSGQPVSHRLEQNYCRNKKGITTSITCRGSDLINVCFGHEQTLAII